MSQYLSHLAALTLNQVEPVQPRLASRFETPVDRSPSDNNGLDVVQESRVSMSPAHVQPSTDTVTGNPVTQKIATASAADGQAKQETSGQNQPRFVDPTGFMIRQSESPGDDRKQTSDQGFASFNKQENTEQASRATQSIIKPVAQIPYEIRKDTPPVENFHTVVERVQERFTETTHSEFVIKEIAAPGANQKISRFEESPRPAPVKPASIVVRSEQSTAASNMLGQAGSQQIPFTQSGTEATPAPTIQVTIGRIEIRATPGAAQPTSKPRAAATTMSLDDYLNRRNGGKS